MGRVLVATEIRSFTCLVPAGTSPDGPAAFDVSFPPRVVDALQVIVPAGPSGLVGWRLLVGGGVIIPYLSDDWIVTAGEIIEWPLEAYPDAGSWSVQAYNTGVNDHSVYFRFLLTYLGGPASSGAYLPTDQLVSASSTDADQGEG